MFEKAYFDEKVGLKYFWFLRVPWTDSLLSDFGQGSLKSKDTQKPEKFDPLFRQNRLFRTSTVSKLAISEGLPRGVLNLCQKVLEICHFSSKSCKSNEFALVNMWLIWLLKVSQKSSKNEFFGSKKCQSFVKKCQICQNNCQNFSIFASQRSVFLCKNWKSRKSLQNCQKMNFWL